MKENIFTKTEDYVRYVLENYPPSRSDNELLTLLVWQHMNPNICTLKVDEVLMNRKLLKIPSMETITRCRRKIVEYDDTLQGTEETERERLEMKGQAIAYARDEVLV